MNESAHVRVLNALPIYFDRDPMKVPAIRLASDGLAGTVSVFHRTLVTDILGGSGENLTIALKEHTFESLVDYINAQQGYTAIAAIEDPSISALALMDLDHYDFFANNTLYAFTSLLWVLTSPISWALDDQLEQIKSALQQMAIPTAGGPWLDLWGDDYYGGVHRLLHETDRHYAERIIREAVRKRVNGKAIELIILEDLGLSSTIVNLHDFAFVYNRSGRGFAPLCFGYYAGRRHSRTAFEVILDGFSADIIPIVERNRAAGTLPFYNVGDLSGIILSPDFTVFTIISSAVQIGPRLVWRYNQGLLGREYLSRPGNLGINHAYLIRLAVEHVFGPQHIQPFLLGTARLGKISPVLIENYGLGNTGSGTVALGEISSAFKAHLPTRGSLAITGYAGSLRHSTVCSPGTGAINVRGRHGIIINST